MEASLQARMIEPCIHTTPCVPYLPTWKPWPQPAWHPCSWSPPLGAMGQERQIKHGRDRNSWHVMFKRLHRPL